MNPNELREQAHKALVDARAIAAKAEAEKRALTGEEQGAFDKAMDDYNSRREDAERIERLEAAEKIMAESRGRQTAAELPPETAARVAPPPTTFRFQPTLRGPGVYPDADARNIELAGRRDTPEYRAAFRGYLQCGEVRALEAGQDTTGGYLVPTTFVAELIQAVDNATFFRQLARIFPLSASESMGAPSLETDIGDTTWTSELAVGNEDASMAFGARKLTPHPLARYIRLSKTLLRLSAINVEALVRARLAYKFATVEENAYLNGTGAGQPLGVFTPSANGINTDRDVYTDMGATNVTVDGLKEAKYTLLSQYWPRANWIVHRTFVKNVAKLKDGEGRYLWVDSIVGGEPAQLLGFPVRVSEYAPATWSGSAYVGILGDFSYYWIADCLAVEVQRLSELYAMTNQIAFVGRRECDGMPVLSQAFVRVRLA